MEERTEWPARAPMLAAIGAITGLCYDWLTNAAYRLAPDMSVRLASAVFLLTLATSFAFVMERRRIGWAAGFAGASGLVVGLVTWWTGGLNGGIGTEPWHLICALLAVAIAAPLFQAARDEEKWRFPYRAVHGHAWTNVLLWCAGCAFGVAVWLLAWLLASLFKLIGIDALEKLLGKEWFAFALIGAALGGAVGLLRERDQVVTVLQRVVTAVAGVLAPVLAVGLLLFLVILPFQGVSLLWQATKHTTPILLFCIAIALILANAVLGDDRDNEARSILLRWGAMGLGLAMLPLALIAAISTAKRIHQYGLTPDRLWAATFVIIAIACALAYLVALLRGRQRWGDYVRPANLRLAFAVCAVALVLATPLAAFGTLSAHDQMARIRDGRTPPDRIDYRALAFDMGKAGRHALEKLRDGDANPDIRKFARKALAATNRWDVDEPHAHPQPDILSAKTQILPVGAVVPPKLWDAIPEANGCSQADRERRCVIRLWEDRGVAAVLSDACAYRNCGVETLILFRQADGSWGQGRAAKNYANNPVAPDAATPEARAERQWAAVRRGEIDIRPVTHDQLFVAGEPTGDVIDPPVPAPPTTKH